MFDFGVILIKKTHRAITGLIRFVLPNGEGGAGGRGSFYSILNRY